MNLLIVLKMILLGVLVGGSSSLLGIGGGVIMVPLLPTFSVISPRETIATSLFTILLVALNNVIHFHRDKMIDWRVAQRIGPLTAVGSFVSGYFTRWIPPFGLKFFLGCLLLWFVWWGRKGPYKHKGEGADQSLVVSHKSIWGMGVFAGLASGLSGLGSGIIVSPLLLASKIVHHRYVVPTTNAIMVFTCFFGVLSFLGGPQMNHPLIWGFIHLDKAGELFVGASLSSLWFRRLQKRIPERPRRLVLLTLLLLLALKEFADAYHYGFALR